MLHRLGFHFRAGKSRSVLFGLLASALAATTSGCVVSPITRPDDFIGGLMWGFYVVTEETYRPHKDARIGAVKIRFQIDADGDAPWRKKPWRLHTRERIRRGPHHLILWLEDTTGEAKRFEVHSAQISNEAGESKPLEFTSPRGWRISVVDRGSPSTGHAYIEPPIDLSTLGENLRLDIDISVYGQDRSIGRETIQINLLPVTKRVSGARIP